MQPEIQDSMILEREWFSDKSTGGILSFDGVFFCYTLEDTCRRHKVYGKTAIPSGRYQVVMDYSPRHKKIMPHILDVPGFDGIRFDIANTADDVLGCVAVGYRRDTDVVYDSKRAHEALCKELEKRLAQGPVYLSVVGGISQDQFTA